MSSLLEFQALCASDPGLKRSMNLDTIESREPATPFERVQKGAIWVIADGFGSPDIALHASRLAARVTVDNYWNAAISDPGARLRLAIERANTVLINLNEPDGEPAGATLVAAAMVGGRAYVANIGKSRAYWISPTDIQQITDDHTWVAAEIAAGRLTPEEAKTHPRRNVVTRALGVQRHVTVDLYERRLEPGENLLLCSDGLTRHVSEEEIATIVRRTRSGDPAGALIAAANAAGGVDNISVAVLQVTGREMPSEETGERLAILQSAGRSLGSSLDLDETISQVMKELLALLGGEHAAVILCDEAGEPLIDEARQFSIGTGGVIRPTEGTPTISRSIVRQVVAEGEPLIVGDALSDPQYSATDSIVGLSLRSVLCVPLLGSGKGLTKSRTIGALYLDSSIQTGAFTRADLDLLITFAGQAAAAIENARLYEETLRRTEEVRRVQAHQQSIIRSMSSALIAIDLRGRVTTWNPAAEQLTNVPAHEAVGRQLDEILPRKLAGWLRALSVQAEADNQTMMIGHDWSGELGDRERVFLTARVAVLRPGTDSGAGRDRHATAREGFVFLINDLTEIVLLEEARRAEAKRRQQIRTLFGRYLAPRVVDQLLQSPDDVQLGGTRQEVTILFADLRGFTTLAEPREPEEVVAILNRFLALATRHIFGEMGTLDKFLGDGVMAMFNAPVLQRDHETAAIRAALAMQAELARTVTEYGARIGFGIGINTGPAIVGNIGTSELMNYTAIGDAVNVAARLQAEAGLGEVLISGSTYHRVRDKVIVEELGPRQVKGRSQPVMIYSVLGLKE